MQICPVYDGAPILAIEGVGDPSAMLARQRERFAKGLAEFTPDESNAQSRCEEWRVKDVICHLISTDQFWAISFGAALRGEPTRFLATFDQAASPAELVERMGDTSATEVLAQYHANVDALLDALRCVWPRAEERRRGEGWRARWAAEH